MKNCSYRFKILPRRCIRFLSTAKGLNNTRNTFRNSKKGRTSKFCAVLTNKSKINICGKKRVDDDDNENVHTQLTKRRNLKKKDN